MCVMITLIAKPRRIVYIKKQTNNKKHKIQVNDVKVNLVHNTKAEGKLSLKTPTNVLLKIILLL